MAPIITNKSNNVDGYVLKKDDAAGFVVDHQDSGPAATSIIDNYYSTQMDQIGAESSEATANKTRKTILHLD